MVNRVKEYLLRIAALSVVMTAAEALLPAGRLEKCARRVFALVFAAACIGPAIDLLL
jgi:hypothetical protein